MNILIISLILVGGFALFLGVLFVVSVIVPTKIKDNVKTIYKAKIAGLSRQSVLHS